MQIVVDELLTHYELAGKGKLVVLLHGWGDQSQGLSGLRRRLAGHYRVLSPDLPGFGGSQPPDGVWDLDDYAAFVANLLTKLDLKQPYAVIGHSNGGALAIRAAALGAVRPRKLVLLAASGIRGGQRAKRLTLKIIAKVGDAATLWLPERYRQALRRSLYGAAGSDMLVMPELQETFKRTVRQDVQADAATIELPVLLIYGEDDRAVPLEHGRTYARLMPNSRLAVIKRAGHFLHLDQPAEVETLIEEFLK